MPEKPLETIPQINKETLGRIGRRLKKRFCDTEKRRITFKEDEWVKALRQLKGIYDPEVLAKIKKGRSRVFPKYTRSKVMPTIAKLNDTLFPSNDKNWEIKSTPNPELSQELIDLIVSIIPTEDAEGNPKEITDEDLDEAIRIFAKDRAELMEKTMDDQLLDLDYVSKGKAIIKSAVILGTGIMKGPLSQKKVTMKTVQKEDGFKQEKKTTFLPFVDNVSLWRWYPDMTSVELENCEFVYELHAKTKHELRRLGQRKNFKSDVINDYVSKNPEGDYKQRQWEIDVKTIKDDQVVQSETNKYEVLEYNGYLDGRELVEIGVLKEDQDPNKDWFVNVWLLGNKVIKAIIHPVESLTDLYHVFYYEKDESSIFGEGLPWIIRDTQTSICSGVRAMLDNAAITAGPITESNEDLLDDDEDSDDMHPFRNFKRRGRGADAQFPAIRVIRVDSHTSEYLSMIDKFERIGDMESTTPALLFSEAAKTTNETSRGVSMRASTMNLTQNDLVRNYDAANESFLKALHKWNMEYNEDEDIKGDVEIKAIGSSSLVTKEARTQAMEFFNQGLSPEDKPYVKRLPMLQERVKMLDLDGDKVLHTEDEAQANIQQAQDSELVALQKESIAAETRNENAKAMNQEARAKQTESEIPTTELDSLINHLKNLKELRGEKVGASPTS
ncbi:MAG: hypothetical protein KAR06_02380 [Deltaproteobacteria bacterium]|nr:hypothetical protein [Deltaproteobacteria bacterium]